MVKVKMKKKHTKKVVFVLNVFLLILLTSQIGLINGNSSGIIWEENFDSNFDDWTLSTIHSNSSGWFADTETGCEIIDKQLHFTSPEMVWHCWQEIPPYDNCVGYWYNYTRIWRSTNTSDGSWSWDMYFGPEPSTVCFVTKTETNLDNSILHESFRYGYRVFIVPLSYDPLYYSYLYSDDLGSLSVTGLPFISIVSYRDTWTGTILGLYESESILNNSWYQIKVMRKYDSLKLYLDGVLRIEVTDPSPHEDSYWDSSTDELFFQLSGYGGVRADNITVIEDSSNSGTSGPSIVILVSSFGVLTILRRKRNS